MSDSLPPSSTDPDPVPDDDAPPDELLNRVMTGDHQALAELFAVYRPRLWRLVNFRLHPKLRGRVDADDLLQDAFLRAVDRQGSFLSEASRSPFLWFRMITMQTCIARTWEPKNGTRPARRICRGAVVVVSNRPPARWPRFWRAVSPRPAGPCSGPKWPTSWTLSFRG